MKCWWCSNGLLYTNSNAFEIIHPLDDLIMNWYNFVYKSKIISDYILIHSNG